jgi:hypothetical protein
VYLRTDGLYAVDLLWDAPESSGSSALTHYLVGVLGSLDDEVTWIETEDLGTSMAVSGLNSEDFYGIGVLGVTEVGFGEMAIFPGPIGPYQAPSGWVGCYLDGVPMWGTVYVTEYSSLADFTVYESSYSSLADLSVYVTDYSSLATSCGVWAETAYSSLADFSVYLTDYSSLADLTIYYTDYSSLAGR